MIVSRAKAEEAAGVLLVSLATASDIAVNYAYKDMAKITHPDMPGGSVEAFARVDWAKQVLLAWLQRDTAPVPIRPSVCTNCKGSGRVKMVHGIKTYTVVCGICRGSGAGDMDNDKQECDDGKC